MKTDTLFHELFQVAPDALFDLLQIRPGCAYTFSSPVLKSSERRLDGLLEPTEANQPRYFLEIQGYDDPTIYWRLLHGISLYHLQNQEAQGQSWQAVVLFLDEKYDPGLVSLGMSGNSDFQWLVRGNIPDLLRQSQATSPVLHVLRPLVAVDVSEVQRQAEQWVRDIRQWPVLTPEAKALLLSLLGKFIVQKFTQLRRDEVEAMLKLTPFEETVAGREWIQEGQISVLARQIEFKFGIPASIAAQSLKPLTSETLAELSQVILGLENKEQLARWIETHTV